MKTIKYIVLISAISTISFSCIKDLDTVPIDPDQLISSNVYEDPANYKMILAKLYAGFAVTGQDGPAGNSDITGIDEGFGQYLRMYWYHQELTTDESIIAWNDATIKDFHYQTWDAADGFVAAMYYRIFVEIAMCNEFIRETTDAKLDERNITGEIRDDILIFRAEARFLRALAYWHALDLFANVPFVTEDAEIGTFPGQIQRADLFDFIESELLETENLLVDAKANEYARVDKAASWMLLAKLYLNAEVYIGTAKNTECLTYCNKIIAAGYSLETDYKNLFLADNHLRTNEIIFPIAFDGIHTQTWGGTTFIVAAAIGGDMQPGDFGTNEKWGGTRTTSAFVSLFGDITGDTDKRAMFYTEGQNLVIEDVGLFTDGYAITKWSNKTSTGENGSHVTYMDTDFPMFRLADVYLMYAEAVLRGGAGGDESTAIGYVNDIRERAYGNSTGNVATIDLDFIIKERGRELYGECHRRTDLIRFGLFTGGDYLWQWKGEVIDGISTDPKFNIFPIPASDITANPNLTQNPGY